MRRPPALMNKHRGFACTKPPSRAVFMKIIFLRGELFLVIATVKTRPVLKVAWQGLSDNWGTQWVKSWGHAEKVMFSSHDSKT